MREPMEPDFSVCECTEECQGYCAEGEKEERANYQRTKAMFPGVSLEVDACQIKDA